MISQLIQAAEIALPTTDNDYRNFWLGAVGRREDGVLVTAKNGAAETSHSVKQYELQPNSHAEGRLLRKLGKNGIIYVARVAKGTRKFAMAMPCGMCQIRIKSAHTRLVYFTINETQYGVWIPKTDKVKIYTETQDD